MARRCLYVSLSIHFQEACLGTPANPQQLDNFKALARELEADEDEARWDERLVKVATHRPAPETETPA